MANAKGFLGCPKAVLYLPLHNLVAALCRLENSRTPEDMQRVVALLITWLQAPDDDSLRRAFTTWLRRVLLPARLPGVDIPAVYDLMEVQTMLAERVLEWTEQWKAEGLQQGRQEGLQQGLQQGRLQEAQEVVLEVMTTRFPALPPESVALVQGLEDRQALHGLLQQALLQQALACPTLEALQEAIRRVARPEAGR